MATNHEMSFVYMYGDDYVGQTTNLNNRFSGHRLQGRPGSGHVIFRGVPMDQINFVEAFCIGYFDTFENGQNQTKGNNLKGYEMGLYFGKNGEFLPSDFFDFEDRYQKIIAAEAEDKRRRQEEEKERRHEAFVKEMDRKQKEAERYRAARKFIKRAKPVKPVKTSLSFEEQALDLLHNHEQIVLDDTLSKPVIREIESLIKEGVAHIIGREKLDKIWPIVALAG